MLSFKEHLKHVRKLPERRLHLLNTNTSDVQTL